MARALQSYDAEAIDRGLLMLAVCAGDAAQTHRRLAAEGVRIPERTLREWKTRTHPQRYAELQSAHGAQLEQVLVDGARTSALLAARLEQAALEAAVEQVEAGEAKDPATVARNAAVTKGINVDQVLKLSGRPTVIAEHRNADDLLDSLAKKLGLTFEVSQWTRPWWRRRAVRPSPRDTRSPLANGCVNYDARLGPKRSTVQGCDAPNDTKLKHTAVVTDFLEWLFELGWPKRSKPAKPAGPEDRDGHTHGADATPDDVVLPKTKRSSRSGLASKPPAGWKRHATESSGGVWPWSTGSGGSGDSGHSDGDGGGGGGY